jgi:hypothetical protein
MSKKTVESKINRPQSKISLFVSKISLKTTSIPTSGSHTNLTPKAKTQQAKAKEMIM